GGQPPALGPAAQRRGRTGQSADRRGRPGRVHRGAAWPPGRGVAVRGGPGPPGWPAPLPAADRGGMSTTVVDFETRLSKVVGRGSAKLARELDLHTVRDLLFHLPRRYEQRGTYTDISALELGEQVTVQAQVRSVQTRPMRNRPGFVLEAVVADDSGGRLTLVFF